MAGSSPRPTCSVSNNTCVDEGTSSLMYSPAPCATGKQFSYPPEKIWAELVSDPPFAAQDKIFTLSHHFQLFARLQNNIDLKDGLINYQPLANPDLYQAYAERMQLRSEWVHAIAQSRHLVKGLNSFELNLPPEQLNALKGYLNRRLLEATPYYTQMANLNLLQDGPKSKAWTRTCNLTTLSMAMEALGVGPEDFNGNTERLQRIANTLEAWRYEKYQEKAEKGVGAFCVLDVKAMRMPDLLQFVAVYLFVDLQIDDLRGPAYLKKISAARDTAVKQIIYYDFLRKIAGLFGVKCSKDQSIYSFGEDRMGRANKIENLKAKMQKLQGQIPATMSDGFNQGDANLNEYYKAKGEELDQESQLSELENKFSQPGAMEEAVRKYQRLIIQKISPELDKGNQIFLHRPGLRVGQSGHYMKLHDIDRSGSAQIGLYIDDPWDPGKRSPLTWRQAYEIGYLDSYMIMSK